jgi:SsrA-binding protein
MKVVARNRRARFDFEITETVEAGLMLTGPEAKSCRMGHVNLAGAYVSFFGGKAHLKNTKIAPYAFSRNVPHEEMRDRQLLLSAAESARLQKALEEKGISVVPLEVRADKYIKVLLGLGRGRKRIDKRQRIKEREMGRNLREGREI